MRAIGPSFPVGAAGVCLTLLAGCGGGSGAPPTTAAAPAPVAPPAVAGEWRPGLDAAPPPRRVLIPRLGIDATLQPLHLGRSGELVPPAYGKAGWYREGPEPGEPGRAVVAGHVDSKSGPDVFAALRGARVGDRVRFRLADGTSVTFVVTAVEVHPRSRFPTSRVYGTDGPSALRLITCTGRYDATRGGYQDNVVVFARLAP